MRNLLIVVLAALLHSCSTNTAEDKITKVRNKRTLTSPTFNPVSNTEIDTIDGNYIIVSYVDPLITTLLPVDCESFEEMFPQERAIIDIRVNKNILELFSLDTTAAIDVRAKIKYWHNGKINIACMDRNGLFFLPDRGTYAQNSQLSKLLFNCLPGWNR